MRDADFPALRGEPDAGPFKAVGRARGDEQVRADLPAETAFVFARAWDGGTAS